MLLGKLPRTKIIKREEEKELRYGYDLRAVQRKSGIKRVVMLRADGRRCPAMPHRISQEAFQQRVSIDGGGLKKYISLKLTIGTGKIDIRRDPRRWGTYRYRITPVARVEH